MTITAPHQSIAENALFELIAARSALDQLSALFEAMKPQCAENPTMQGLVALGYLAAEAAATSADCAAEKFELQLAELAAPQNDDLADRGAEVEGSQ